MDSEQGEGQFTSPLIQGILKYRNGYTEVYEGPAASNLIQQIVIGRMTIANMQQQQQQEEEEEASEEGEEPEAKQAPVARTIQPVRADAFRTAMDQHEKKLKH